MRDDTERAPVAEVNVFDTAGPSAAHVHTFEQLNPSVVGLKEPLVTSRPSNLIIQHENCRFVGFQEFYFQMLFQMLFQMRFQMRAWDCGSTETYLFIAGNKMIPGAFR